MAMMTLADKSMQHAEIRSVSDIEMQILILVAPRQLKGSNFCILYDIPDENITHEILIEQIVTHRDEEQHHNARSDLVDLMNGHLLKSRRSQRLNQGVNSDADFIIANHTLSYLAEVHLNYVLHQQSMPCILRMRVHLRNHLKISANFNLPFVASNQPRTIRAGDHRLAVVVGKSE
jgi:hypothetical protein